MRRHYRIFIVAALAASLLDPTFAEVVVQPGYSQGPKAVDKDESAAQNQQPQNSYVGSSQPTWEDAYRERWRQQQLYQQQLQRQRQQYLEQYQRYQQQQQLYRQAQMQQYMLGQQPPGQEAVVGSPQQKGDADVVGSSMILPMLHPYSSGKTWGGRTFTLGPLGLYSQSLGGHGGLGGLRPLLLAPNPQSEQTASDQVPKKVEEAAAPRGGRKARDVEGQRFRHKSAVYERNGLASDSAIASGKQTRNAPSLEKMKDDADASKKMADETVGAPLNLDPLGLGKKAEDLFGGLSFLPPPSRNGHHSFLNNDSPWSRDRQSSGYDDDDDDDFDSDFDDRFVGSARSQDAKQNGQKQNGQKQNGQKQNLERHHGDIIDDRRGFYYPPPPRGYGPPGHPHGMYPPHGPPPSPYRPGWGRSPVSTPKGSPYSRSSLAGSQAQQPSSLTPQLAGLSSNRQDRPQLWGYGTDPGSFFPFGTYERTDLAPMVHEAPLGMRLTDGTSFYRVISAPASIDDLSQQIASFQSAGPPAPASPALAPQSPELNRITEPMDPSFANWPAQMMGLQPMSGGSNPFGNGMEGQSLIWAKSKQPPNNYGLYPAQSNSMVGKPSPDFLFNEDRDTTYIRDGYDGPARHRDFYDDRAMYNAGYGGMRPVRVHEHHESQIY